MENNDVSSANNFGLNIQLLGKSLMNFYPAQVNVPFLHPENVEHWREKGKEQQKTLT